MAKVFLVSILTLSYHFLFAQNYFSIDSCESQFKKNNLLLLAQQYNIDASRAAVIQAKIWEQPYFAAEFNALNPQDKKILDVGANGQKGVAVQQLIYMGGKKKREVDFAKSNVAIAALEFEELLRNLKFQLAQNFYNIYFDQQKVKNIDGQIVVLEKLLAAYEIQSDKGNLPLKEVVRLQTLVLGLKNERTTLQKEITRQQQELQLITGSKEIIHPIADEPSIISKFNKPKYLKDSLLVIAAAKNPDYLIALKISESQELFLRWQQSLAKPDITTGLSYDQRGGAFNNQVNLTIGMPLRLWNRNKGNIKMAEAQVGQSNINKEYKLLELQSLVESAWIIWQQQQQQLNSINQSVAQNLETVYQGILANFQKRNITSLEFTDFMESYNQSTIQLNEMKKQLVMAGLQLNYITNTAVL